MRQKIGMILAGLLLAAWMAGCGTSGTVYIEQKESVVSDSTEDTNDTSDEVSLEVSSETSQGVSDETYNQRADMDPAGDSGRVQEEAGNDGLYYVHVCGAVYAPGVYALAPGSRVYEALLLAGGLTEEACEQSINQAELLWDGEMIFVPTEEEAKDGAVGVRPYASAGVSAAQGEQEPSDGRIDLNTAGAAELMTLPGIGQTKAESILAYREKNGAFSTVEEIMQVDGIKEGLYTRIKDKIRVK